MDWIKRRLGDPCAMCGNEGEVWMSGRMVPCICDGVSALNRRLREQLADVRAERDAFASALEAAL